MDRLNLTTFIIPSIRRRTLQRAIDSIKGAPYLVGFDDPPSGDEGHIRQRLIEKATTPWVSFLDDDDTVTEDYVQRLEDEIINNLDADLIYFRAYWADSGILLPAWPVIGGLGVGVYFSVRREVALEHPFVSEQSEDQAFVRRLERAGKKVVFSKYMTYRVRH